MTISNPSHWKELYGDDKGPKYDKIVEMIAELNTPTVAPISHKTSHQNGGGDEINVAALSGLLADQQTPLAHKTSHQNGGGDEINVAGLSGELADSQIPKFPTGTYWLSATGFMGNATNDYLITDGIASYSEVDADTFVVNHIQLPYRLTYGATTKYLKITSATLYWRQIGSADQLDRFRITRYNATTGSGSVIVDDATNRGTTGYNNYTWALSTNNVATDNAPIFAIIPNYFVSGAGSDFRILGCKVVYEYA